jgi:hypothetical protein
MGKTIKGESEEATSIKVPKAAKEKAQAKKVGAGVRVYQLKILLVDSEPEIFRRVLVAGDTTLYLLHLIIQTAMGWTNSHLHEFFIKGVSYADPDPEMEMEDSEDESAFSLQGVAPRTRSVIRYAYDFGDDWEHKITVEKIAEDDERYAGYPVCIEGQYATPPEDSGGIYGYYENLEVLKDPNHEEYEDILEWMGEDFDPDEFDIEEVNRVLKRMKPRNRDIDYLRAPGPKHR